MKNLFKNYKQLKHRYLIFTKCVSLYWKQKAHIIQHQNCNKFLNEAFINDLRNAFIYLFTCLIELWLKKLQKLQNTVNVTIKKDALLKIDTLQETGVPSLIEI